MLSPTPNMRCGIVIVKLLLPPQVRFYAANAEFYALKNFVTVFRSFTNLM